MFSTPRPTSSPDDGRTNDHDEIPFSALLSEQWLLERTSHAHLLNGRELSIARLTQAMNQLIDSDLPFSSPSATSPLPERLLRKKSSTFSVPISTWQEITQEEAMSQGNTIQIVAPSFCYYHEVTCPSGTYRLEFFGPRMNEQGYPCPEQLPALALEERSR